MVAVVDQAGDHAAGEVLVAGQLPARGVGVAAAARGEAEGLQVGADRGGGGVELLDGHRSSSAVLADEESVGITDVTAVSALQREAAGDMLSAGVVPGTVQVPPSGQPIILMGDALRDALDPKRS